MTSLLPTNVYGGFSQNAGGAGGLGLIGLTDDAATPALRLNATAFTSPTAPAILVNSMKKSGTSSVALAASEIAAAFYTGATELLRLLGNGVLRLFGQLLMIDGAASGPAASFNSDQDTGLYLASADNLAVATGGARRAQWHSSGQDTYGRQQSYLGASTTFKYDPQLLGRNGMNGNTSTTITTLHTYTIPAGALGANGDGIHIVADGRVLTQQGQFQLDVAGVNIWNSGSLSVGHLFWVEIHLTRDSSTSFIGKIKWSSGASGAALGIDVVVNISGSATWTSDVDVLLRGKTNVAGGNFSLDHSYALSTIG